MKTETRKTYLKSYEVSEGDHFIPNYSLDSEIGLGEHLICAYAVVKTHPGFIVGASLQHGGIDNFSTLN